MPMKRLFYSLVLLAGLAGSISPAVAQEAAAAAAKPPEPSLEQRIVSLEAYINNTDPTTALKDKEGKIPEG